MVVVEERADVVRIGIFLPPQQARQRAVLQLRLERSVPRSVLKSLQRPASAGVSRLVRVQLFGSRCPGDGHRNFVLGIHMQPVVEPRLHLPPETFPSTPVVSCFPQSASGGFPVLRLVCPVEWLSTALPPRCSPKSGNSARSPPNHAVDPRILVFEPDEAAQEPGEVVAPCAAGSGDVGLSSSPTRVRASRHGDRTGQPSASPFRTSGEYVAAKNFLNSRNGVLRSATRGSCASNSGKHPTFSR